MPANHAKVKELFLAVLEMPAAERAAYLDTACAGDTALRQQIEVDAAKPRKLRRTAAAAAGGDACRQWRDRCGRHGRISPFSLNRRRSSIEGGPVNGAEPTLLLGTRRTCLDTWAGWGIMRCRKLSAKAASASS